jgi:hypothetical protein
VRRIPTINFAHRGTGQIYAQIVNGKLVSWNRSLYELAVHDDDVRRAFERIAAPPSCDSLGALGGYDRLDTGQNLTLGQWADGRVR